MTTVAQPTPRRDIDPRGIHRKQVRVLVDPNGGTTLVEFECGHISEMAQHFTYKVGDVRFCFKCGKEALACNSFDALTEENKKLREALNLAREELSQRAYVQESGEPNSAMKLLPTLDAALKVTP